MGFTKALGLVAPLLAALGGVNAADVQPIVMKGTKFFYQNGTQFFIKGVAYQQDVAAAGAASNNTQYKDPLSDATLCQRDIPLLTALGTNTIRTYAIDPTVDHSACMQQLQAAGIYVISDLSEPNLSINRDSPAWNTALYKRYTDVVDEMSKYPNVIGFFAGNEVSNAAGNTNASAFVKAAVRDTKAYIQSKNLGRWMGVGYAANDDPDIRGNIAHYFNCGDQSAAIDFWGYNMYEWCGHSSFQQSGYQTQVEFFSNYSVPVFFAEYGCNTQGGAEGRIWEETTEIYSSDMTGVMSGGIVYMYFEETNDYGIVSIQANGQASAMKNYASLSTRLASVSPTGTAMSAYTPSNSPAACPSVNANWQASNLLPPTPNATVCNCMYNSLSCVPSPNLATTGYGKLFGYLCGAAGNLCAGINGNPSTGVFGAYSMCNDTQKLGYVLDAYYKGQKYAAGACDFQGQAVTTKAAAAGSACTAALQSASSANSVAATATAGTTGSGTGSGSGSGSTSSSFAVPVPMGGARFALFDVVIGLYVLVAVGAGAGMVLL